MRIPGGSWARRAFAALVVPMTFLRSPPVPAQYPAIVVKPIPEKDPEDDATPVAPRFGERGEFVVTGGSSFSLGSRWFQNSEATSFAVEFEPSLDYFFVKDIFVGGELDLQYSDAKGYLPDGSLIESKHGLSGAGIHGGVNVPMGRRLSLMPRVGFGVHRIEDSESTLVERPTPSTLPSATLPSTRTTWTGPWVSGGLYLLFHAPRFFIGIGPRLYHDFSQAQGGPDVGAERTTLGAGVLVGGHFGAGAERSQAPPEFVSKPSQHFGDAHTVALTSDFGLSISRTTYSGTDTGWQTISIAPGFDWFFVDRWSLGLTAWYVSTSVAGFDPRENVVSADRKSTGVSGRTGVDVRVLSDVSVYPRLSIGYGVERFASTAFGPALAWDDYASKLVTVTISVPVLVHVAGHFFIGIGPNIAADLMRTVNGGEQQNRGTAVGLSTVVGGWL